MGQLTTLFDEVRLLDHRLVQVADAMHAGHDVSVPGRAVLEYLHRHGPTSVPGIARARYVTRQHIQAIVDGLSAQNLVTPAPNPAHRRSPLFDLTARGRRTIVAMQQREERMLKRGFAQLNESEIEAAAAVLAALRAALDNKERP